MRKITFLKSLLLLCALMAGVGSVWGQSLTVDFESEASAYTDWTFTNIDSKQTNSNVTAHGGSYFGNTCGKMTASMMTKNKIASPKSITFYVSKQSTNTTACSWKVETSSDGEKWNQVGDEQSASSMAKGTWVEVTRDLTSYSNVYVRISYGSNTAVRCIDDVTLSYIDEGKENVTLSFPKATYTADLADGVNSFDAPTATATPSVSPIIYMSSNTAVATVDENTGAVTLVKKGETKIIASFAGNDDYNSAEASYTLTVNNSNANDGSESKPFTVEEAIDFITAKEYGEGNYYVKGIISKISSSSVSSGTLTYYISDDGTTTNQLQVFKGKNLENADFTDVSNIEEGDAVVVVGPLLYYNDKTPEIKDGNYIYSLTHKKDLTLVVENVEMFVEQEKAVGDLYLVDDDYDGEISFSSSAEAVAKVEGSVLKALTVGTATITVTAAASSKYKGTEETFTVTVKSRDVKPEGFAGGGKYVLLTDASTLAEGDKLIVVCESKSMAMGAQSGTKCDNIAVTISDHAITELPSGVKEVTLESATGGWYLKTDQGYLTSTSAKSIKVEAKTDDASVVTIGIDTDNNAKIDFGDAGTLQYNASSPRFCTYTSDQTAVQIYRYTETTTFDIEMGAAGWRTLVSAQDVTLPEGLTAYVVTANDGGSATLATAGSVKANTPYILNGDEGTYTLTMALGVTAPASNLLKISDESTGNGVYVLYNGTQGVGFYKWYGGSLGAGRVYLPATAGAPEFIALGGETTGIDMVQGSSIKVQDPEIYNLAGQRVARPTKGLYIVNGKKVVIR
jgi:uncharacterized Zn ribbon protein